jgi:hypothetical protein
VDGAPSLWIEIASGRPRAVEPDDPGERRVGVRGGRRGGRAGDVTGSACRRGAQRGALGAQRAVGETPLVIVEQRARIVEPPRLQRLEREREDG